MRAVRHHALVLLFYFMLAVIITFPVILSLNTQFLGGDNSDAYEMARHTWWFKHALQNGLDPFWQSNLGYPDGFSGVSLQADILQFFPMWFFAFFMPIATAYNITILLTMALNGWAVVVLLRYLIPSSSRQDEEGASQSMIPALIAGVIFMAAPTFQGHLFEGHAGLMVQYPVPLYLLALFKLTEGRTLDWRWLLSAILFFQMSPSGHMLQVIYMLIPVTGLFLLARLYQRDWAAVRRILLMGVISSAILLIFLIPLIQETLQQTSYTDAGGYVRYSADLLSLVSPSFFHPLFGQLLPYTRDVLGVNLGESSMYVGIIAGILAVVGVAKFKASRWWLLLAGVTWVLSLGPLLKILDEPIKLSIGEYETYLTMPLALVQNMPGVNLARTPGRFNFAVALALAVMAGYGAAYLWEHFFQKRLQTPTGEAQNVSSPPLHPLPIAWRGDLTAYSPPPLYAVERGQGVRIRNFMLQWGVVALVTAGILFEYQSFFPMPTRTAYIPDAVYALRERDEIRAVFDIPYDHLLGAKDALFLQTAHEKSLVAGHVTRETPVNPAKLAILQTTLDPGLLNSAGADIIILHKQRAAQINQLGTFQSLLAQKFPPPIYEDDQIAIYETPVTTRASAYTVRISDDPRLEQNYTADFYTPDAAWVELTATLSTDAIGRTLDIFLNNTRVHRLTVQGTQTIRVPLPVENSGYYRVRLAPDPPCPEIYHAALTCRTLTIGAVALQQISAGLIYNLIQYEDEIELAAAYVPAQVNHTLNVRLWWRFAAPLRDENARRFVHVLDTLGNQVAGYDSALITPDKDWVETVALDVAQLPPGEYQVRVGWYQFPDLRRFAVLTPDIPGSQDAAPEIGWFTINTD